MRVYIGKTGCLLRDRITRHRFSMSHNLDTRVVEHFSQPGHYLTVSVLQSPQEDAVIRRLRDKMDLD